MAPWLVLLSFAPLASAQPTGGADADDRTGESSAALAAQQQLNEQLLARLAAIEQTLAEREERLRAQDDEDDALLLELLELQSQLEESSNQGADLHGYFDFAFLNDDRATSNSTFRQHHLSLQLTEETDDFRMFSEIEFEHGAEFAGNGGTTLTEANGKIELEQTWGEWVASNLLTVRAGKILTPGYWNVNHYSNVVLSSRRPLLVKNVFRPAIYGVMAYGTHFWDDLGLTWTTYVGNGQGADPGNQDDNEGKALGGRVTLHLPHDEDIDTFDVGFSAYREKPRRVERTRAIGADAQFRSGRFELLTEYARRNAAESRSAFYAQPSWRLDDRWALYYRFDRLTVEHVDETHEHTLGVNFRPAPNVSLKLEAYRSIHQTTEDFAGVAATFALAF